MKQKPDYTGLTDKAMLGVTMIESMKIVVVCSFQPLIRKIKRVTPKTRILDGDDRTRALPMSNYFLMMTEAMSHPMTRHVEKRVGQRATIVRSDFYGSDVNGLFESVAADKTI